MFVVFHILKFLSTKNLYIQSGREYYVDMDERIYWLGFSVAPGIGPKRFSELLAFFGSAQSSWEASESDLEKILRDSVTQKFLAFRKAFPLQRYNDSLQRKDVTFVTLSEEAYPPLLKKIPNPPFLLYVKGNISALQQRRAIGIVGTRRITSYGRTVTQMITRELVENDYVIVSGLAMGVDAVAHRTAVENNRKTIAVLGCGVDCCTPQANQYIYNSILAKDGCIISEYALGALPTKGSFPARNRIIAGISEAVVVTEGTEDSGALITAEEAFQNNRKVFAVPGPITSSLSKGPNSLLVKGAHIVTSGGDILKEMGINSKNSTGTKSIKGDTEEEQKIIELLQNESLHFDELVKQSGFDSSKVSMLLSLMELSALVVNDNTGQFSLKR